MRAARADANQQEIIDALRDAGASVESLHRVGGGVPDLLAGFRGGNYLLECKDGSKPPSRRKFTDDQLKWHGTWRGQKAVVCSVEQALRAIGAIT